MLETLRGSVRPLVTFIIIIVTALFVFLRYDVPEQWWTIAAAVIAFWFAARAADKKT